jgi:hypothetical protein
LARPVWFGAVVEGISTGELLLNVVGPSAAAAGARTTAAIPLAATSTTAAEARARRMRHGTEPCLAEPKY